MNRFKIPYEMGMVKHDYDTCQFWKSAEKGNDLTVDILHFWK